MRRLGAAATAIFAGAALLSSGAMRPASADPGDSPIAGSRQLAPAPPDYFAGRLRPVPELVERQDIKGKSFVPMDPVIYDVADRTPEQFRQSKTRTTSGIWKLTEYYAEFGESQFDYTTPEATLVQFGSAIDHWQAGRPKSPTPVVVKGLYLIQYAQAATFLSTTTEKLTSQKLKLRELRFEQAYQYMAQNKTVGSLDPHWYAAMLRVMGYRCASGNEMMKILEEGAVS